METRGVAGVVDAGAVFVTNLPIFAAVIARRCLTSSKLATLTFWALNARAGWGACALVTIFSHATIYIGAEVFNARVHDTQLRVGASFGESLTVVKLTRTIFDAAEGACGTIDERAASYALPLYALRLASVGGGHARNVGAAIDKAEIVTAALVANGAGEFGVVAGEGTLAVATRGARGAKAGLSFVYSIVAIVVHAVANFNAGSLAARANKIACNALQNTRDT